jgi:O-antigen/teichoic acid export membrane protein
MSERFELSFKNKEVRIWFYIAVPYIIIGSLFLFIGGPTYNYVSLILLVIAWITSYTWRFLYRRKQKNEVKKSS